MVIVSEKGFSRFEWPLTSTPCLSTFKFSSSPKWWNW